VRERKKGRETKRERYINRRQFVYERNREIKK